MMSKVSFGILSLLALIALGAPLSTHAQQPYLSNSLSFGSTGTSVTKLQTFLAADQHVYPLGLTTGYYGALTEQAVKQFQLYYGIDPVGNVGPITLAAINNVAASAHPLDVTSPSAYKVSTNATSNSVTLNWPTGENTYSKVFYAQSPILTTEANANFTAPGISGSVVTDTTSIATPSHNITIGGLLSRTTYYYVTESSDNAGNTTISLPATLTTL